MSYGHISSFSLLFVIAYVLINIFLELHVSIIKLFIDSKEMQLKEIFQSSQFNFMRHLKPKKVSLDCNQLLND